MADELSQSINEHEPLEFPTIIKSSPHSGFFGNWDFLSDDEKAELNQLAAEEMAKNEEWNEKQRARNAIGLSNPTIYCFI